MRTRVYELWGGRPQVEKDCNRSQLLYKEIFDASKDAIAIIAPDGIYLEQNPAHRALMGYMDDELQGKTPAIHLGETMFQRISLALEQHGRWRGEVVSRTKSGQMIDVELSAFTVKDSRGNVLCHVGIKRDISERKRAEHALSKRASEQFVLFQFTDRLHRARTLPEIYQAALDAIIKALECQRASVLLFDEADVMQFVAWAGLSEQYRKAVAGHSPWRKKEKDPQPICIEDVDVAEIPESLKAVVKGEGIGSLAFFPLIVNGKLVGKFMAYYDSPHTYSDSEISLGLTIARQLAFGVDHKRAEEKLEQIVAERTNQLRETVGELEAFSYSIAHDMRAPLRAMTSFSQVLEDDFAANLPEEGRNYLRRISVAAERLDRLIQDVLNYSKITRGELPLEKLDVEKLTREIIDSYSNLQERGTSIVICPPIPCVVANPAGLTQCISNLLSNAVKFVPPGVKPQVRIWAESRGGMARIWFEDNGIGISPEGQARIFRLLQRLNPATEFEGTGIGLTIVRKAVERMGGRVGVESSPGQGSRFWIELARCE